MSDSHTPLSFKRDDRGLIEGVTYHYTSDGRIDWARMVDPRFLYVSDDFKDKVCAEQGVTLDKIDVTKVRDDWLRIRIGGINQLANLRGYMSLEYSQLSANDSSVTVVCTVEFIPSFETGDLPFSCAAIASANILNMDRNKVPYLAAYAENRAFTRCVKRALQINVVSDIEIGGDGRAVQELPTEATTTSLVQSSGFDGNHFLKDRCTAEKVPFKAMQDAAIASTDVDWTTPPASWTDFESVGRTDAFVIIGKMDKAKEARAGAKAKK